MPSNLPAIEGYDPNRRTTLHLSDERLLDLIETAKQRDELLAALEAAVPVLSRVLIKPDGTEQERAEAEQAIDALANARAAIRKAKGEQC